MMTTAVASTEEIATYLVEQCRQQNWGKVIDRFYTDTIVSVEAMAMPNQPATTEGFEAVKKASEEWAANNEVNSVKIGDPIITGNHFAVTMWLDFTCKMMGDQSITLEEIVVYEVQNGKIVRQ